MKIKDERILNEHNLITAKAYSIVLIGMMLVTFYRMYVLNQSFSEYRDYVLVMSVAMLYTLFMTIKKGLYHSYAHANKSIRFKITISIAAGIGVIVSKILSGQNYGNLLDLLLAGITATICCFVVVSIALMLSAKQAEKTLSDDLEDGKSDE